MRENSYAEKHCSSSPLEEINQPTTKRRGYTEDGEEIDIDDVEVNSEQESVFPAQSAEESNNRKEVGVELLDLTAVNVRHLKLLNVTSLMASYEDRFYKELLQSVNHWHLKKMMFETAADLPKHWAKLAYFSNTIVGPSAVSFTDIRLSPRLRHANILTLASLPSFRRRGVASLLLKNLLEWCQKHANSIKSVYLHVQTNNEIALKFYEKFDFQLVRKIENYYRRIDPPDAYLLERKISD
uniref:N-terminal methionine N(alpha)-acetyltransferase NatE n=1 Tax=Ditylenchus dipsaci TaxID=166011 RepID=A0A915DXM2_9BILA